MTLVLGDPSGLGRGIETAGGALARALEMRAQNRLMKQQTENLQKNIEQADLSTREGQREFLSKYPGDKKEALAIIKEFNPSYLDQVLQKHGYTGGGPEIGEQPQENQQPLSEALSHPATKDTPYSGIPNETLAALSASENPRDRDFSDNLLKQRNNAHKIYNENRNYADKKSKKFLDNITDLRASAPKQRIALNEIKFGLENRDPQTERMDWWADKLGQWTEPLISPGGSLIQSGVKNYLISDLKGVKGRPNQYLEGLLLNSLPGLGKSRLANKALEIGLEYRADIDELKIKLTDELSEKYEDPNVLGYVPPNIERLVAEQMQPIVDEWGDKHAYNLRRVQEEEQGLKELSAKKVVQGTPLTLEMMTYIADSIVERKPDITKEEAINKARKKASQLGYKIPTKAEYRRYNK